MVYQTGPSIFFFLPKGHYCLNMVLTIILDGGISPLFVHHAFQNSSLVFSPSSGPDFGRYIDAKELEVILRKGAAPWLHWSLLFNGEWVKESRKHLTSTGLVDVGWRKNTLDTLYGFDTFSFYHHFFIVQYYTCTAFSQWIWNNPNFLLRTSCKNVNFANSKESWLSSVGWWILTHGPSIPDSIVSVLEAMILPPWIFAINHASVS